MLRKIKNLKNGDVFMVTMPSGKQAQCTMLCEYALKGATEVGFAHDVETANLSVEEKVDVVLHLNIDKKQIAEYKNRFIAAKKKKMAEQVKEEA